MRADGLTMRLVDTLYIEAMILADEARSYFDERGRRERDSLPPLVRVCFTCESLKVTTRLMHVIAWLLTQRAVEAGEISRLEARDPARRLGQVKAGEPAEAAQLPETARAVIAASHELYERVRRLDQGMGRPDHTPGPARQMIQRLERAF